VFLSFMIFNLEICLLFGVVVIDIEMEDLT